MQLLAWGIRIEEAIFMACFFVVFEISFRCE